MSMDDFGQSLVEAGAHRDAQRQRRQRAGFGVAVLALVATPLALFAGFGGQDVVTDTPAASVTAPPTPPTTVAVDESGDVATTPPAPAPGDRDDEVTRMPASDEASDSVSSEATTGAIAPPTTTTPTTTPSSTAPPTTAPSTTTPPTSVCSSSAPGSQVSWRDVEVQADGTAVFPGGLLRAFGSDGANATVHRSSQGIAVAGNRYDTQIDYVADTGSSEALVFEFTDGACGIELEIAQLALDEGQAETGRWTALDADGVVVAEGLIERDDAQRTGNDRYRVLIDTDVPVRQLIIQATLYEHGEGESLPDNDSDFSVLGWTSSSS